MRGRRGRASAWREQSRVGRPGRTEPCKVGPGREKLPWALAGLGGPGWALRLWVSEKFPGAAALWSVRCALSRSGRVVPRLFQTENPFSQPSLAQTEQIETTTLHVGGAGPTGRGAPQPVAVALLLLPSPQGLSASACKMGIVAGALPHPRTQINEVG